MPRVVTDRTKALATSRNRGDFAEKPHKSLQMAASDAIRQETARTGIRRKF
jgi:hypothetical protein